MIRRRHVTLLAMLAAVACSHSTPTQPRTPTELRFVAQPQTVTAGAPIDVQVSATDSSGSTVTTFTGQVSVAIGTNPGAATLKGTTTVAAVAGVATFTTLAIDSAASGYTLTASTAGLPLATSSAFNILNGPSSMTVFVGGGQPGLTGYATNIRPAVQLTDFHGNPVPGISVTFTTRGGGTVSGSPVLTDSNGVAQSGAWVLGPPGTDTLIATAAGASFPSNPTQILAVSYAQAYPITLQPYGPAMPAAAQTAFNNAVAKWQTVIYRPLPAQNLSGVTAGACASGTPALSGSTTGVVIYAAVDAIDGPGKILAEAGPCLGRPGAGLTAVGLMLFDSADIGGLISAGTLNSVIEHEMGHVLGFGTEWGSCLTLPSNPPGTINDTYFGCPRAQAQFDSIGGGTYSGGNIVPVENCGEAPYVSPTCGTGTVNGHWRQVAFVNELMVGFLPSNPQLSVVTIASLEDIGYTVNYAGADHYTHTFTVSPVTTGPRVQLMNDIWQGPRYVATPDGVIHLVRPSTR